MRYLIPCILLVVISFVGISCEKSPLAPLIYDCPAGYGLCEDTKYCCPDGYPYFSERTKKCYNTDEACRANFDICSRC